MHADICDKGQEDRTGKTCMLAIIRHLCDYQIVFCIRSERGKYCDYVAEIVGGHKLAKSDRTMRDAPDKAAIRVLRTEALSKLTQITTVSYFFTVLPMHYLDH